jgi:hypothetical protein
MLENIMNDSNLPEVTDPPLLGPKNGVFSATLIASDFKLAYYSHERSLRLEDPLPYTLS